MKVLSDTTHMITCDGVSVCWTVAVPDHDRDDTNDRDAADTRVNRLETFNSPVKCSLTSS